MDHGQYRSCRVPPTNQAEVKFSGRDAKIRWVVSLDGKTLEQETYKIIAVLDAAGQ